MNQYYISSGFNTDDNNGTPSFSGPTNQYTRRMVDDDFAAMKEVEMLHGENTFGLVRSDHSLVQHHHHHEHMYMKHEEPPTFMYSNFPHADPSLQSFPENRPIDLCNHSCITYTLSTAAVDGEASAAALADQTLKPSSGPSSDKAPQFQASEEQKRRGKETFKPGDDVQVRDTAVPRKQATKSTRFYDAEKHNLSEKRRRDRINSRMIGVFSLVPNCHGQPNKCAMFDEAIKYIKSLQQNEETLTQRNQLLEIWVKSLQQQLDTFRALIESLQQQLQESRERAAPAYQLTLEQRIQELEAMVELLQQQQQLQECCTMAPPPYQYSVPSSAAPHPVPASQGHYFPHHGQFC